MYEPFPAVPSLPMPMSSGPNYMVEVSTRLFDFLKPHSFLDWGSSKLRSFLDFGPEQMVCSPGLVLPKSNACFTRQ